MARRSLKHARVLLTGASSGIGWALAQRLADEDARLLVTGRRQPRLEQLTQELSARGVECHWVAGDIAQQVTRDELMAHVHSLWDGLDVLINNAGVGAVGPFAAATSERLRTIMEVNFFAPVELARQALPFLRRGHRPILVNIGSVLGHCAVPDKSEYCASKFALHGWNDAMGCELRREGIDVLLVSPSTTRSEFFDHVLERNRDVAVRRLSMSPDAVARQTVAAIRRGRVQRVLSGSGRTLIWLDRLCPALLRRLLARWG